MEHFLSGAQCAHFMHSLSHNRNSIEVALFSLIFAFFPSFIFSPQFVFRFRLQYQYTQTYTKHDWNFMLEFKYDFIHFHIVLFYRFFSFFCVCFVLLLLLLCMNAALELKSHNAMQIYVQQWQYRQKWETKM